MNKKPEKPGRNEARGAVYSAIYGGELNVFMSISRVGRTVFPEVPDSLLYVGSINTGMAREMKLKRLEKGSKGGQRA